MTATYVQYKAAGNSIQQRGELLSACAKQIEKDMVMLGAIGIEDELQDGVPEVRYMAGMLILGYIHCVYVQYMCVRVWLVFYQQRQLSYCMGEVPVCLHIILKCFFSPVSVYFNCILFAVHLYAARCGGERLDDHRR